MSAENGTREMCTVTMTRYRDRLGRPTCALNFITGEVCKFYRTQRFGCNETCIFCIEDGLRYYPTLRRRTSSEGVEGDGTLIPCVECVLWSQADMAEEEEGISNQDMEAAQKL